MIELFVCVGKSVCNAHLLRVPEYLCFVWIGRLINDLQIGGCLFSGQPRLNQGWRKWVLLVPDMTRLQCHCSQDSFEVEPI